VFLHKKFMDKILGLNCCLSSDVWPTSVVMMSSVLPKPACHSLWHHKHTSSSVLTLSEAGVKAGILINGDVLIQSHEKTPNCDTSDDYANVFIKILRAHLRGSFRRLDFASDRGSRRCPSRVANEK